MSVFKDPATELRQRKKALFSTKSRCFAVAVMSGLLATPTWAGAEKKGPWAQLTRTTPSGQARYCEIALQGSNGATLAIGTKNGTRLVPSFVDLANDYSVVDLHQVSLAVDHGPAVPLKAAGYSENKLFFLGKSDGKRIIAALEHGQTLTVQTPQETMTFSLKGFDEARRWLTDCGKKVNPRAGSLSPWGTYQ